MVALDEHFQHNGTTTRSGGGSIATPITLPNTDQSRNYTLDGLGNWKTGAFTPVGGNSTTDQRNHNYVNEIIQRTVGTNPAVTFQYDGASGASNGNLKNDGAIGVSYDALNRPIQINRVSDGLVIATYVYDAMNRRVRKTVSNGGLGGNVPNGTTDYIWSGWQVMEERNSGNAPIRQYVWGTYIDECIELTTFVALGSQNLAPGSYYLLQDLLYRAVALTNSSGAVVEAYDCDAYGNTLIFTGPGMDGVWFTDDDVQSSYGANEIMFCGYRCDPESQLYYVRNRTYSPVLGRWIQRDPIGYAGGVSLYEYIHSASSQSLDPFGLWEVDAGIYAAGEGSVDFLTGIASLKGWLWAGIGVDTGPHWYGWSAYFHGTLVQHRFGFLDWFPWMKGQCACKGKGDWWSTGPAFFKDLHKGENKVNFGLIEFGVLLEVSPQNDTATIEGVLIWRVTKDLPAAWLIQKVLKYLHVPTAIDVLGDIAVTICPRKGGGVTVKKAEASLSLGVYLGHKPGWVGSGA